MEECDWIYTLRQTKVIAAFLWNRDNKINRNCNRGLWETKSRTKEKGGQLNERSALKNKH